MQFERHIIKTVEEVATTFRAMAVCGPRQVGKTWLLKCLAAKLGGYETVSLDDESLREQARTLHTEGLLVRLKRHLRDSA